jgi:hypothetical protein
MLALAAEGVRRYEPARHHRFSYTFPREQDRQRVLQAIRECEGGLELRLDLRGIACDAQAHRTNAIRADARMVSK